MKSQLFLAFFTVIGVLSQPALVFGIENTVLSANDTGIAQTQEEVVSPSGENLFQQPSIYARERTKRYQAIYQYILAELAAQQGDFKFAATTLRGIAFHHRDSDLGKRGLEFAIAGENEELSAELSIFLLDQIEDKIAIDDLLSVFFTGKNLNLISYTLVRILEVTPENLLDGMFVQIASFYERHPKRDQAWSHVEKLVEPFAKSSGANFLSAKAEEWRKNYTLSLEIIELALKARPDFAQAIVLKASLIARDNVQLAIEILDDYLHDYPLKDPVRVAYARTLFLGEKYLLSRDQFVVLSEKHARNSYYAYSAGVLSAEVKDYHFADKYLERALFLDHHLKDNIRFKLGMVNEALGRNKIAKDWFSSVDGGVDYILARSHQALILQKEGKPEQAIALLNKTKPRNDQQEIQLVQAKAHLLRINGDYQESYDILNDALKVRPKHQDLLYEVALAAEKINRLDFLEEHLKYLIRLNPRHAQAYNALGYTLADRTDRFSEALKYIEIALSLEPEDPYILDSMGWVCFKMRELECGKKYLKMAYDTRPDPEIAAHLGELLWFQGDEKAAEKLWTDALNANPNSQELQFLLRKYLDRN